MDNLNLKTDTTANEATVTALLQPGMRQCEHHTAASLARQRNNRHFSFRRVWKVFVANGFILMHDNAHCHSAAIL